MLKHATLIFFELCYEYIIYFILLVFVMYRFQVQFLHYTLVIKSDLYHAELQDNALVSAFGLQTCSCLPATLRYKISKLRFGFLIGFS